MITYNPSFYSYELWGIDPYDDQKPPVLLASCPTQEAIQAAQRLLFPSQHHSGKARRETV